MSKISAMPTLAGASVADGDLLETVDVSDTSGAATGTNKSITAADLATAVGERLVLPLANPPTPATGLRIYGMDRARTMLATKGESGVESRLQPHMGMANVAYVKPTGSGTVVMSEGVAITINGVAAAANWSNANILTQTKRVSYRTAATAGAIGGMRESVLKYWRGNAPGLGGFHYCARFGFSSIPATRRWCVGLRNSTSAPASGGDPSALQNIVLIGQDLADTTIQFIHNDATGAATKVDSGMADPTTGTMYEANIFCAPNDSRIQFSIEQLNTENLASHIATTDLPVATTGLALLVWTNNDVTAAVMGIDLVSLYTETRF